jgi:hypothetical protein
MIFNCLGSTEFGRFDQFAPERIAGEVNKSSLGKVKLAKLAFGSLEGRKKRSAIVNVVPALGRYYMPFMTATST